MTIYYYKGKTLSKFCKDNNINESNILYRIYNNMTVEQAVDSFFKNRGKENTIYKINGISVKSLLNDFKLYQKFCRKLYRSKDKNVERIYNEIISQKF